MTDFLAILNDHTGTILSAAIAGFGALAGAIVMVWRSQENARAEWHAETRASLLQTTERLDECDRDRKQLHEKLSDLSVRLARIEREKP